jgi:predicted DNA-binding helix-hairpin-helix protein
MNTIESGLALAGEEAIQERTNAQVLPTLQRNALSKFFNRSDFSPVDILSLGYPRLQKLNGIGPKGIEIIVAWVRSHGFDLKIEDDEKMKRQTQRVERAIRFLEKYGYEVRRRKRNDVASRRARSYAENE